MNIIFSRHGNTFEPGETPIWVGARQDLPLVASGIQQAKYLARSIQEADINLSAIYCGPLKRTRDYAQLIVDELRVILKPVVDPRLSEIDYGSWSGLSTADIQKKDSAGELAAWEQDSQWPEKAGWSSSAALVTDEVRAFANDVIKQQAPTDSILAITSNGRLRYFLRLIPGAFEQHIQNKNFKVSTGNLCLLAYGYEQECGKWQVEFWNKKPEFLLQWRT